MLPARPRPGPAQPGPHRWPRQPRVMPLETGRGSPAPPRSPLRVSWGSGGLAREEGGPAVPTAGFDSG